MVAMASTFDHGRGGRWVGFGWLDVMGGGAENGRMILKGEEV